MSTFMGAAWVDLLDGADASALMSALRDGEPRKQPSELDAWVAETPVGRRLELAAGGEGYEQLALLVSNVMQQTGAVRRAVVALDHDEYGAEHIVLVTVDQQPHRVHHVFVYPRDEETGEPYIEAEPTLTDVPPLNPPELSDDPGALVDGSIARASLARLFDIPTELVDRAAVEAASAHEGLQIVGEPFAAWLKVLNVPWIGESGAKRINLRSDGQRPATK